MSGPRSMTGFGRSTGAWRGGQITVEARSVNHRFLEVRARLPHELSALEAPVNDWVRSRMSRGRVDVLVTVSNLAEPVFKPQLNLPLAKEYARIYRKLAEEIGRPGEPEPGLILSMRDVIVMQEENIDPQAEWEAILPIFRDAFGQLEQATLLEGEKLAADVKGRLSVISGLNEKVAGLKPNELAGYRERLAGRLRQLGDMPEVSEDRLAQEMVFYAERSDSTEEYVRLKAHLERFDEILDGPPPMGRTLDFLAQEMLREINTTASKALTAEVSQAAVEMKAELEKIREQIQNME